MNHLEIHTCVAGPVQTNCYLAVNTLSGELFIVDPGDSADDLSRAVRQTGAAPCAILLTHGHFDHILAVKELKDQYRIPVYAFSAEKELLGDSRQNMSAMYGRETAIVPDILLEDDQQFTVSGIMIRCLHTPGHTPGSCCYYLPEENVLFSGDTLFHGSVGRTDFPGGSMSQIRESLHRLIRDLPSETQVFPGHDAPTRIGIEARYNPFV